MRKRHERHGRSNTAEYHVWENMMARCFRTSYPTFCHYGGRGISVCKKWKSFINFFNDMGYRPSRLHELERINNNRGYSPSNCRWATRGEQMNNTRANHIVVVNGRQTTLTKAARKFGVSPNTLKHRFKNGRPGNYDHHRYVIIKGRRVSVAVAARLLGVTYNVAYGRLVTNAKES